MKNRSKYIVIDLLQLNYNQGKNKVVGGQEREG